MKDLKREDRVMFIKKEDNSFEVLDRSGNVILDKDSEYFIYMKNVNFKSGKIIQGRYLGSISENDAILGNHCKNVVIKDNDFYVDDSLVKTARMVAVNNKKNVIIIVSNS